MKKILFILLSLSVFACKKVDDTYEIPTTYNFDNIDISGQLLRVDMLSELAVYMKNTTAIGSRTLEVTRLKNMFMNVDMPFSDQTLNDTDKQLKNKTVSTEQALIESWMATVAVVSQSNTITASNGQAGVAVTMDSSSRYLVTANGVELPQMIEKVLMGACFYYQATAVYLGLGKMASDNILVVEGVGTNMEHHWDEAFGYFSAPVDFPTNTTGLRYWAKYSNTVDPILGSNKTIMDAFLAGRAAISNKDYQVRDEQIAIIRKEWERVIAAVSIHYLNKAKDALQGGDVAVKLHAISEAYAFLLSIEFGGAPSISTSELEAILSGLAGSSDPLRANFYTITQSNIDNAIQEIVGFFPSLAAIKDSL